MLLSVAPTRRKELLNMVYHKGQSWDLYFSSSILMIYLCIYHQILQNVICSRMTPHFIQQEKVLCKYQKTLQLCLDCISVWCNTNHMLNNPVKTKSMVITTQQKHQLSDLLLRLSFDGQNIESVTEHRQLGLIVDNKFRWQAQIEHIIMQKHVPKTVSSFSTATYLQIDTRNIFYNAHIKPHVDYALSGVGWLWRSTLKRN